MKITPNKLKIIKIVIVIISLFNLLLILNREDIVENRLSEAVNYKLYDGWIFNSNYNTLLLKDDKGTEVETLKFIVDITDIDYENNIFVCNTATLDGYSGIAKFTVKDVDSTSLEIGKCYVLNVDTLLKTDIENNIPVLTVVSFSEATNSDIKELEDIRKSVSNYNQYIDKYNVEDISSIIESANKDYAKWTQEEIIDFNNTLIKYKYSPEKHGISYVKVRAELNGSYITYTE